MTTAEAKQTLEFQTEAKQLLHLMIHSLYSNKEIFLRELISNASDACDKLRFEALSNEALYENQSELSIQIEFDKDAKTLTLRDNGIGMNRDEVIQNLGTIARSGTKEFLQALTGDQKKDAQLIGQFGVGFYSAFIVAQRVEVKTRRAGEAAENGVHWESEGEGNYSIEALDKAERGTEVILHLRDDELDLLEDYRLRHIIKKYSDHISLPVMMRALPEPAMGDDADNEKESDKEATVGEWEAVNEASALWSRAKTDISDEEYNEFYKAMSYDYQDPLAHVHSHVEGNQSYTSLFFLPKNPQFDLWDRDKRHGIKLYVKRVYIMDDAEHLMPNYLRFVRGVVDSADLPLNVSREILQSNPMIDKIRAASVKKVLGMIESIAAEDKDKYLEFWKAFGRVLKEGPSEDHANKERIAKLFRFSSSLDGKPEADVSLDDYIARMKPGQEHLYYIVADSFSAAKNSPHLEIFKKKGIEVLLMFDRVDEWLMSHLHEYDGKSFKSVAKGELDLSELGDSEDEKDKEKDEGDYKELLQRMQKALGEKVKEVRVSKRLTDSPSCLVVEQNDMGVGFQNLLKQAGHEVPTIAPSLEVNVDHVLVQQLKKETDEQQFSDWSHMLFDQALLSEGGQLDDPAAFVGRLNSMLTSFALSR